MAKSLICRGSVLRRTARYLTLLFLLSYCGIILVYGTVEQVIFSMVGYHPRFVTVNPLDMIHSSCRRTLHFFERQPVDKSERDFAYLESLFSNRSLPGGHFRPDRCKEKVKTAIIIPYRDRKKHLTSYLYNVVPKLLRQQIHFTVFVVEQTTGAPFNRGMMRNIGFLEAKKMGQFDCFIFNDVDTLIEDDRNIFSCNPDRVRHLISSIDRHNYRIPYSTLVGGIIGFTDHQFTKVNGYSNLFFMWGAEDDDIFRRVTEEGFMFERPPVPVGAVTTLKHIDDPIYPERMTIYNTIHGKHRIEGLNTLNYQILKIEKRKLFTWIYVDVDEMSVLKEWETLS